MNITAKRTVVLALSTYDRTFLEIIRNILIASGLDVRVLQNELSPNADVPDNDERTRDDEEFLGFITPFYGKRLTRIVSVI